MIRFCLPLKTYRIRLSSITMLLWKTPVFEEYEYKQIARTKMYLDLGRSIRLSLRTNRYDPWLSIGSS
jgi:hypothetical protein